MGQFQREANALLGYNYGKVVRQFALTTPLRAEFAQARHPRATRTNRLDLRWE